MIQETEKLMVKVAKLYYIEGWTQMEISKMVNVSRPIISKLLKEAKEANIVSIYIKDETAHTVELERALEHKYNLKEAIVLANDGTLSMRRQLGEAAASYLAKRLDHVQNIGVSWGKSVQAVIEAFGNFNKPNIHLTPLIGGMGENFVHLHSNHLTFQLAQKLGASCSYLYAPAVTDTPKLKEEIVASKDVADVLKSGREVDIAIVGVGNPVINNTMREMGYLKESDQQTLIEKEAAGDVNSNFYKNNGEAVEHSLNERKIAISLEDLHHIPEVISIVEGDHKVESMKIALTSGYINTIILDDLFAQNLLR